MELEGDMSKQKRSTLAKMVRGWLPLAVGLAWPIPCIYGYFTGFFS
jgi:hypothetical protein